LSNSKIHSNFVKHACKQLKRSGSANLASIQECNIVFLDTTGRNGFNAEAETGKHKGQITVKGLRKRASAKDLQIISEEAVKAYNQIFMPARYSLDVFTTSVAAPLSDGESQLFMVEFQQNVGDDCRGCVSNSFARPCWFRFDLPSHTDTHLFRSGQPPDDDAVVVGAKQLKVMHANFEKAFCGMLQHSDKGNLVNAHDCAFHFVIDPATVDDDCRGCPPDDDAVTAQQ